MVVAIGENESNNEVEKTQIASSLSEDKVKKYRITVEPLGFLVLTASIIQSIVTPNLYLYKVCAVNFNINATLCDPRSNLSRKNIELVDRVQKYVSTLQIYGSLIDNVPSIFVILFLLPWSDKHGRKPLMIAPLFGHILCTLIDIANYYSESWPAEYLLIATVPVGLTGGRSLFFMAMNRYMIDITSSESRTWRLSLLGGMIGISVPIANLLSGYIYDSGGNMAIWATALAFYLCAFIYILFGFKDSRGRESIEIIQPIFVKTLKEQQISKLDAIKNSIVGAFKNLIGNFIETFKRREGFKRACISLLIAMTCFQFFSSANGGVGYLYTRKKFGWGASDWAYHLTTVSSTSVIGTLFILPVLSGYFKVGDGIIGSFSLLSQITTNLVTAFAVSPLMMQLTSIGQLFNPFSGIVIRSLFSKTLSNEELSPAYSVLASIESLIPLITAPTVNLIYQATLSFFPGCIFLFRALINFIVFGLFGILFFLKRKDSNVTKVQPFSKN